MNDKSIIYPIQCSHNHMDMLREILGKEIKVFLHYAKDSNILLIELSSPELPSAQDLANNTICSRCKGHADIINEFAGIKLCNTCHEKIYMDTEVIKCSMPVKQFMELEEKIRNKQSQSNPKLVSDNVRNSSKTCRNDKLSNPDKILIFDNSDSKSGRDTLKCLCNCHRISIDEFSYDICCNKCDKYPTFEEFKANEEASIIDDYLNR